MGWAISGGVLGLILMFGAYRWLTGWSTARSGGMSIPMIGTRPRRLAGVPEEAPRGARRPPGMEVLRHGADALIVDDVPTPVAATQREPVAFAESPVAVESAHPDAVTAELPASEPVAADLGPVVSAGAESGIVVSEVHQGSDDQGEHVVISNGGANRVALEGWKITDEGAKHTYEFPAVILNPEASLRVHMWRGEDTATDLYVGRRNRWWNDTGDTVYLYDGAGTLVHSLATSDAS